MGTDRLIERELPQWIKSMHRHAHFSQSLETEEMADAELDVQVEMITALSAKPAQSPTDMLLKLKLWESFTTPESEDDIEARLILSVIRDLESFVATDGGAMATYAQAS